MKLKQVIAATMATILIIGNLTGCGKTNGTAVVESSGSVEETASVEVPNAVNKTGYPIMNVDYTFKIVHSVASTDKIGSWENKDFVQQIAEDTGLKIEWVGIPEASYNDQVAIMIAAGDLPDVFIGQVPNFAQFLDSFYKLDDMIADYTPSLADFYRISCH